MTDHPVMRRTPSTDSPDCAANARSDAPSARAERSAAFRRSVHSRTFTDAVSTSPTACRPQFVDAQPLCQLTAITKDLLRGLWAKVLRQAGDDLDVGGAEFFHVHNVDGVAHDVNNVDAPPHRFFVWEDGHAREIHDQRCEFTHPAYGDRCTEQLGHTGPCRYAGGTWWA